ncbi:hypothetical protein D3C81_1479360 [compost metagenome]
MTEVLATQFGVLDVVLVRAVHVEDVDDAGCFNVALHLGYDFFHHRIVDRRRVPVDGTDAFGSADGQVTHAGHETSAGGAALALDFSLRIDASITQRLTQQLKVFLVQLLAALGDKDDAGTIFQQGFGFVAKQVQSFVVLDFVSHVLLPYCLLRYDDEVTCQLQRDRSSSRAWRTTWPYDG